MESMRTEDQQEPSYNINDIYYVLFRHKWKILFFSIIGAIAAAHIYTTHPRLYQSSAKIMVRYIVDSEGMGPREPESRVRSPDMRGEALINAELEIISSFTLAREVAIAVGPELILRELGGGSDPIHAALVVNGGTKAEALRRGNVIQVTFQHPDSTIVQTVLEELMDQYVKKHVEIHRALASLDDFARRRDEIQHNLSIAEQKLFEIKRTNEIYSIEEEKRLTAQEIGRIRQALGDAETELVTRTAVVQSAQDAGPEASAQPLPAETVPESKRDEYARVTDQWGMLRKREMELLGQFTESSSMVRWVREEINSLAKRKLELEREHPGLLALVSPAGQPAWSNPTLDAPALEAKIVALKNQLQRARDHEARLYRIEAPMTELERNIQLDAAKLNHYSTRLEQARIDAALGSSRTANINRIQEPTPPRRDIGALYKNVAAALAAGIGAGLGLALLLEMFVDQTVKRPGELIRMLNVPLYLSVPRFRGLGRSRNRKARKVRALIGDGATQSERELAAWCNTEDKMQPYFEALRDRVMNRFEGLTRKPKLVGVCGCRKGSGVTTIAAGLAAALSQTDELKVLLVDMKNSNGRTHALRGRKAGCNIFDALEQETRSDAMVAPNLYLASAQSGSGQHPVITSPPHFTRAIPQMSASDYDYIVFDLPSVDQVSITPRLSKHMDLVLLVAESEKVNRSAVKKAGSLLLEFTPNVSVIMNKTREYVPEFLSSDD
jgi:polysaccharide biosynthesis transport protein